MTTTQCTKAQAMAALAAASYYQEDEDRFLTHSFLGPFGADWDFAAAVALIERAELVRWAPGHVAGHELEVWATPDKRYFFNVKAPREEKRHV